MAGRGGRNNAYGWMVQGGSGKNECHSGALDLSFGPNVQLDAGDRYLPAADSTVATRWSIGAGGLTGSAEPALQLGGTKAHVAVPGVTRPL